MTYAISRRTLLRGTLGVATAGTLAGVTSASAAEAAVPKTDAEIYGVPTVGPLISQRADPFITPRTDGMYYFTASVPEYDRIVVRGATTIAGLAGATETVIWRRPTSGKMGGHIWAPELHRINGRWYMYFAAGDSDNVFRIRTYVLESSRPDPLDAAGWQLKGQMLTEWDGFTLDSTTFAHRNRRYMVYVENEPEFDGTSLYIAEMASPLALKTKPTRIASPTHSWEVQGFKVNEGPAVLIRNGRVFMTFSASATDSRYCMGLLTASAGADLLDRSVWKKAPDPVFVTNDQTQRYGPGHNSFTVAEDGVTDVLVYHARDYKDITGDPLYDPNRHTRVQRLYWHPDGTPLFGVPVGDGGPIVRISPADRPEDFVRHTGDSPLRVERQPRDLAATQFRFATQADGTESIRSVDRPDRYLRVDGDKLRLDATPSGFRRTITRTGIKIQVDGGGFLRASGSGITVAGQGTVFRLS